MSFIFNKHNPKSYVVRGDVIENLKSRQEFISKLTGKCVFNTRLKFGPGLLVPINNKNTEILNSLSENISNKNEKRLESVIVPYDDGSNDKKEENNLDDLLLKLINDDLEENPNKEDSNKVRGDINITQNEVVGPPTVETKTKSQIDNSNLDHTFKIDEKQINKISVKKNKKIEKNKNEINKHKEKQVSIIDVPQEMSSSDRTDKSRIKKSSERESRGDREQKRDPVREKDNRDKSLARNENSRSRDEHSSKDRRERENDRREREKERSRRDRRRHESSSESDSSEDDSDSYSSSESSDYSGDSSEDERIQETIRRKGQRPNRRKLELDDSDVDSDHEDIVTLSRRVRYILKKLHSIENFLRK